MAALTGQPLRSCQPCRDRGYPCDGPEHNAAPCSFCRQSGNFCDYVAPVEEPVASTSTAFKPSESESDELRSQLKRLERLIAALQSAPEPLRRKIAAAARNHVPKKPEPVVDVETADLVAAMSRLCFTSNNNTETLSLNGREDIVREARASLEAADAEANAADKAKAAAMGRPATSARSVNDLVALLPPWPDAETLLLTYASRWWGADDAVFPPSWHLKVGGMYESTFQPPPHPHFLAELFAVFALSTRGLAVEAGKDDPRHAEAERWAACAQRALDIGTYLDRPSLECIRALALLVSFHAFWGTALARGLTILPVALSLVMQLDFHRPDADFEGSETILEAYERRALVSVLVRADWAYPQTLGRASIADPKVFLSGPATYLDAADLPPELVNSSFRLSEASMQALHARHAVGRLQQRMATELFASNKMRISYSAVRRYASEIDALEASVIKPELRYLEDSKTGQRRWAIPEVDRQTASHRIYAVAEFCLVRFDEAMHLDALVRYSRAFLWLFGESLKLDGNRFVAVFASSYDPILALGLVLLMHTDLPARAACRADLISFAERAEALDPPPAVRRLARLTRFLIQRGDEALRNPKPTSTVPRKRVKRAPASTSNVNAPQPDVPVYAPQEAPPPAHYPPYPSPSLPLPLPAAQPLASSSFDFFMPPNLAAAAPAPDLNYGAEFAWPTGGPAAAPPLDWDYGLAAALPATSGFSPAPVFSMASTAPAGLLLGGSGALHGSGMPIAPTSLAPNPFGYNAELANLAGPDFGHDPLAFLKGIDAAWSAGESSELQLDSDWLAALARVP